MDPEPHLHLFSVLLQFNFNYIEIALVIILLICSGLVSGSEVAFFSLGKKDIDELEEAYPDNAYSLDSLLNNKKDLLATILVLNNFINIAIVVIMANLSKSIDFQAVDFNGYSISSEYVRLIFDLGFITFLILLFGEIIPKVYAQKYPMEISLRMVRPISFFRKFLRPITKPLMGMSGVLENIIKPEEFSVDQLSQAIELTSEDEETSMEEQKILEGIVNFGNTTVKEIMTPRVDMFSLSDEENFQDVKKEVKEQGYSRIPIHHENEDDITGILYAKDLISHLQDNNFDWLNTIRKPLFVPENKKLDDLLAMFQDIKTHMAVVVDEYGGTLGLVTLEDVIEEIVGEISDEFDEEEVRYTKIDDRNYIFEGKTSLKDFLRVLDIDNQQEEEFDKAKGEAETIAGFILEQIDVFPSKGQIIPFHLFTFTIETLSKKRIEQVKVSILNEDYSENN